MTGFPGILIHFDRTSFDVMRSFRDLKDRGRSRSQWTDSITYNVVPEVSSGSLKWEDPTPVKSNHRHHALSTHEGNGSGRCYKRLLSRSIQELSAERPKIGISVLDEAMIKIHSFHVILHELRSILNSIELVREDVKGTKDHVDCDISGDHLC